MQYIEDFHCTAGAGINGIGLSMVIPSGQSMVADYYPEERRGAAFGALYLTGAVGAMLGALRRLIRLIRHQAGGTGKSMSWRA